VKVFCDDCFHGVILTRNRGKLFLLQRIIKFDFKTMVEARKSR
jgi:hypothetical protein